MFKNAEIIREKQQTADSNLPRDSSSVQDRARHSVLEKARLRKMAETRPAYIPDTGNEFAKTTNETEADETTEWTSSDIYRRTREKETKQGEIKLMLSKYLENQEH